MDHVNPNEIQGHNIVFFKAQTYGISFCQTWSMVNLYLWLKVVNLFFSKISLEKAIFYN